MLWSDPCWEESEEITSRVPRPLVDTRVTTIMLCRHGESVGNLARKFQGTMDLPLSHVGHLQAQYTGRFLKPFGLTALWTSPQLRALRTAEEIATHIGIPFKDDARLTERYLGQLQGRLRRCPINLRGDSPFRYLSTRALSVAQLCRCNRRWLATSPRTAVRILDNFLHVTTE